MKKVSWIDMEAHIAYLDAYLAGAALNTNQQVKVMDELVHLKQEIKNFNLDTIKKGDIKNAKSTRIN